MKVGRQNPALAVVMSNSLFASSRSGLRRCRLRRFYSSETPEKAQPQTRTPRASDFGGIQIAPPPQHIRGTRLNRRHFVPLFSPDTSALSITEFREGSVAQRLAKKKLDRLQKTGAATTGPNIAPGPWSRSPIARGQEQDLKEGLRSNEGGEPTQRPPPLRDARRTAMQSRDPNGPERNQQAKPNADRRQAGRPNGELRQPGPPGGRPRQSGQPGGDRRQSGPQNADMMQTRRDTRRGSGSAPQRRRGPSREKARADANDLEEGGWDDNVAVASPFKLRRPDPLLPPPPPVLPPPLTALEIRFDVDRDVRRLHERQGGDYERHFSGGEWKLARGQSVTSLGVTDRARLALSLNQSLDVKEKRLGVQMVKKNVGKAELATAP